MKRVFLVPAEIMTERYTGEMFRWICEALDRFNIEVTVIAPEGFEAKPVQIQHGEFLDTFNTSRFKAQQVIQLADHIENHRIRSRDILLFGESWYPGIESLKFMCDLQGVRPYFAGWHHAGIYDPADYLTHKLGKWARRFENMLLLDVYDYLCIGSRFHAQRIIDGASDGNEILAARLSEKLYPFGQVWKPREIAKKFKGKGKKEKIVVFPHRWSPEKSPESFMHAADELHESFPDWTFAVSTNSKTFAMRAREGIENWPGPSSSFVSVVYHETKEQYYQFLDRCSIMYSNAVQETFGYCFHEAIALGLCVVVPNRLSYREAMTILPHEEKSKFVFEENDYCGVSKLEERMLDPTMESVHERVTLQYEHSVDDFLDVILFNRDGRAIR